jgi:ectoine hydroxylase-related dioxygenase (phytanoyl-CoA dioxygenase family)
MELTRAQKRKLFEEGFLKIASVIPQRQTNLALRTINHSVGKGIDPRQIENYRASSYCPELAHHPAITDLLYKTAVWPIVTSLTAKDTMKLWGGAQIALRFPVMEKPSELHPHIDGMYRPGNRIPKGTVQSFTMLVGVLLSDVPNEFWGNFTVWPGTHRLFEEYLRKHGTGVLSKGLPPVRMPQPQQLLGKAGDVLFCHYQTAHTVVSNVSPYIRYAIFFRLMHQKHEQNGDRVLTDIWLEWPGMRAAIAKE